MRVTYYSAYAFKTDNASTIRASYFLKELQKKFEVKLISPLFPPASNSCPLWWRLVREVFSGIDLSIRLLFSSHKLVILSSPPYITILIASLSMTLLKRKFILDIRDPYPEVLFELNILSPTSILGRTLKRLTKFSFSKSLGIVVTTHGTEKIIRSYKANENIIPIFNGFDPEVFTPSPLDQKFERFTLVFHGNLARMQNIDLLIQVARRCPEDIDILVAGSGPLEKKVKQEQRITFLGMLPYKYLATIVNKSHVGLSFRKDGFINTLSFPVKIFEYMGAGLPVISTPQSDIGYLLEENNLGYQFQNMELEEIIEKILYLKAHYRATQPDYKFSRPNQAKVFTQFIDSSIQGTRADTSIGGNRSTQI